MIAHVATDVVTVVVLLLGLAVVVIVVLAGRPEKGTRKSGTR